MCAQAGNVISTACLLAELVELAAHKCCLLGVNLPVQHPEWGLLHTHTWLTQLHPHAIYKFPMCCFHTPSTPAIIGSACSWHPHSRANGRRGLGSPIAACVGSNTLRSTPTTTHAHRCRPTHCYPTSTPGTQAYRANQDPPTFAALSRCRTSR